LQCHPWQIGPAFTSWDFVTNFFYPRWSYSPTPNPQHSWRTDNFLSGLCPLAGQPWPKRHTDATKRADSQTLACTQTCFFRVKYVFNM
jgi:hypothetical protein